MKKIICVSLLIITVLSALSLFSCSQDKRGAYHSRTFYTYFDTVGTFYDYKGLSDKEFNKLADEVENQLKIYHELYDIYNEYEGINNIATLNKNAGKGALSVDEKIIDLLSLSKELYTLTGGEMNIAMGSVLSIWHNCRDEATKNPDAARLPSEAELGEAAKHINIEDIVIDRAAGTVELMDEKMSLDVGAIAKGYAVEEVANYVSENAGEGFVLDVGGNLRAIGAKPSGAGWTTGVRNPNLNSTQTVVYKTEIKDAAMVTSGSYERFYTVQGVRYHHIINSESLHPENYYASVSVMSESSALSDALSTALFNMEYEELSEFVSSHEGLFVILVMTDGKVEVLGEKP